MALELKQTVNDSPKYYKMSDSQKEGIISIWERCVARWQDNVNHEKMPIPSAFLEMVLFIKYLEDRT